MNGLDTFGYHFVNLFLHISTAFLFYLLLERYVSNDKNDPYHFIALIASAIFLLHPINSESVTYISSRSSELSTLLMLSTMLMFFSATEREFRSGRYLLSILFFILGLSSKETVLVTPALMLFFDRYFVTEGRGDFSKRLKYHLPFWAIVLSGAVFYSRYIIHPEMYDRPWLTHILTELKVFTIYLRLLFVPIGLNIDHDIQESVGLDAAAGTAIFVIVSLILLAFAVRKKYRILSFSILWFFINIGPLLALRLSDYMADRWAYAASLGFALGLSVPLAALIRRDRRVGALVVVSIALTFGIMTYTRNSVYLDPITLWADALKKSPEKIRPYTNLSASYLERGNITKAIEVMELSIKRGNRAAETYQNLAMAYFMKDDLKKAERIMLSGGGTGSLAYDYNLGVIYKYEKKFPQAIDSFEKALKKSPFSPAVLGSIGECYKLSGRQKTAEEYFRAATKGIPQTAEDYLELARSHFELKQNEQGTESLNGALLADPLNIHIRNIIATTLLEQHHYDEAYKHYAAMAKISPYFAAAYRGMGAAMIKKGDLNAARKHLEKALALLPPDSPDRAEIEKLLTQT